MPNLQIFLTPPKDFKMNLETAGCFINYQDKLLYVKRHPNKPAGNTWTIPGGKLDPLETPEQGAIREIFEETGIILEENKLIKVGTLYIRHNKNDFPFHIFSYSFEELPNISLALDEHTEEKWVTINEVHQLPLIKGGEKCLELYEKFLSKNPRNNYE